MSNDGTERCPLCSFEQDELCVIGDYGAEYACNNADCRVSVFYPKGVNLHADDGPNRSVDTGAYRSEGGDGR